MPGSVAGWPSIKCHWSGAAHDLRAPPRVSAGRTPKGPTRGAQLVLNTSVTSMAGVGWSCQKPYTFWRAATR